MAVAVRPSRSEVLAARTAAEHTRAAVGQFSPPVRTRSHHLNAAAAIVSESTPSGARPAARQNWQAAAWDFHDQLGELHYASEFYGNCMARVTLQAGVKGRDGKVSAAFDDEGKPLHPLAVEASKAIAELRSPIGGQPQIMRSFGINLSMVGECHLVGDAQPGGVAWEVLSTDELRKTDRGYERVSSPGAKGVRLEAPYIVRIWQSHARYSQQADSSVRAVLDVCEELVLLTRQVLAATTSRIAGNLLLLLPDELDLPDDETAPDGSAERKPFVDELLEYMVAPIKDRASAASVAPMPVTGKAEFLKELRILQIPSVEDSGSVELRKEAVLRLAQGIDLPVEVVTGHMQTTFANAAQIDEATFKAHLEPKCELVVDGVTEGYLHPTLKSAGHVDMADADGKVIVTWYDASELITHPNQDAAVDAAYGTARSPSFLISAAAGRRIKGFAEADAPDDAEIGERIRVAQLLNARETIQGLIPEGADASGTSIDPAAPVTAALLAERLAAAAEVSIERAVERAGARLRSKANGDKAAQQRLAGVVNRDVAGVLGGDRLALMSDDDALAGEFDAFRRSAAQWATEADVDAPYEVAAQALKVVVAEAKQRMGTGRCRPLTASSFTSAVS